MTASAISTGKWLVFATVLNSVIALSTIPIIARGLGPTNLGYFAHCAAIAAIIQIIVEFGFTLSAPTRVRDIQHAGRIGPVVIETLYAKTILLLLVVPLIIVLIISEKEQLIFSLAVITGLSTALNSNWAVLAYQKTKLLFFGLVVLRCIYILVLILIFIPKPTLATYASMQAIYAISTVLVSYAIISSDVKRDLTPDSKLSPLVAIKNSWKPFISSMTGAALISGAPAIVSLHLGQAAAGLYFIADRIRGVATELILPLLQASYSKIAVSNKTADIKRPRDKSESSENSQLLLLAIAASFVMFMTAKYSATLLGGKGYEEAKLAIQALSPLPAISAISSLYGTNIAGRSGKFGSYTVSSIVGLIAAWIIQNLFIQQISFSAITCGIALYHLSLIVATRHRRE